MTLRAPRRSPDRRYEVLFSAVAEFDLPGDGRLILFPAHAHTVPERREIGIAAAIDRELQTSLHAGVALPAHIGFDVERAPVGRVDVHDVGRADIDTVPATVAARHINGKAQRP